MQKESPLNRSFVMQDYLTAVNGLNVVKAVYMEVDVEPAQQPAEADYLIDICRQGKTPTVAAVIFRPARLGRFRQVSRPIQGRSTIHQGITSGAARPGERRPVIAWRPGFACGIRLLGERNLSFDLCMRAAELRDGIKLAETCPNTRFILDHCGKS